MIKRSLFLVLLTILLPFYGCYAQIKKELKPENISVKIDTLLTPEIGGIKQVIEIKTDDFNKPILLSSSKLSVKQMEEDTYQVINFIIKELPQEKNYLLGSSWGNVLGFRIVKNHPELLHSYFTVNPVISPLVSEKALLKILKIHFKENALARKELARVKIPFTTDEDLFYLRKWFFYKEGKEFATSNDFKKDFLQ